MLKELLADRLFLKKLRSLALPIAFQSLMLAAVAAADALMLGRVEQNAMAAVSLAGQIQFVQNMAITSIISAFSILGAQYWGKKDTETLNEAFCITLRANALVSLLFFVACRFTPRSLMLLFTNEEALIAIGMRYLRIAAWSYLLTGVSQCYLSLLKVTEHASQAAWVSSGAVIINIVLNAMLIFGLAGLPAMGVQGAATATLIARAIELVWSILLFAGKGYVRPRLTGLLRYTRLLSADFRRCMWPLLGAGLFWGIGFTSYTAFVGHMGADAAAANSVAAVIRDLICCLCNGIAYGGGILVGNELGAGNTERGRLYGDRLHLLAWISGLLSTAIMLALTPAVVRMVKLTDGAAGYLTGMMVIMAFYMIGRTVNTVLINGIFAAGGDTLFDMYSLAVCMWGLAVPLAALGTFVFHWPVLAVYACTCLDEVGKIPWVVIHYRRYRWVRNLTREREELQEPRS